MDISQLFCIELAHYFGIIDCLLFLKTLYFFGFHLHLTFFGPFLSLLFSFFHSLFGLIFLCLPFKLGILRISFLLTACILPSNFKRMISSTPMIPNSTSVLTTSEHLHVVKIFLLNIYLPVSHSCHKLIYSQTKWSTLPQTFLDLFVLDLFVPLLSINARIWRLGLSLVLLSPLHLITHKTGKFYKSVLSYLSPS